VEQLNGEYVVDKFEYSRLHQSHGITTSRNEPLRLPGEELDLNKAQRGNGKHFWYILDPDELPDPEDEETCLFMPHSLPGYHLRDHVWRKLPVRNMEPISWPEATVEDALIGDQAIDSLRKLLGALQKPEWWTFRRGGDSARIVASFQGPAMDAAINVASRMTKRPLYRICFAAQTEALDTVFQEAKYYNAKWGCIFVVEDLREAYAAHTQAAARLNLFILPLLRFLDSFTGILVFRISDDYSAHDFSLVDPRIRQRICKHFAFTPQDNDEFTRKKLWRECIKNRLNSPEDFTTAARTEEFLAMLATFTLTWDTIRSIVHAVLPQNVCPTGSDWKLLLELARERAVETSNPGPGLRQSPGIANPLVVRRSPRRAGDVGPSSPGSPPGDMPDHAIPPIEDEAAAGLSSPAAPTIAG
jgi:hypothetical protein